MNKSKKILIVEDDDMLREMYKIKLTDENFNIDVAKDGNEGLMKIKEFQPDLVLLDLIMPRKNGFELLEEVSRDKGIKGIPIIVLSNLGQQADINLAKSLGAKDYVIKSNILLNDLVEKINAY